MPIEKSARAIAILLLPLALLAGACGDEPTAPGDREGAVRGVVSTLKGGTGVPNLVVVLMQGGRVLRAQPTDAEGRFALDDLAPGTYTAQLTGLEFSDLSLRHTAFEPLAREFTLADEPVDLVFAAVGLIPPQVVGRVHCDGAPIEGAEVRVIGGEVDRVVATNAQGKYGATNLVAGHYAVIPVNAPCTVQPSYHAVEIRPGQTVEADFGG